MKLKFFKLLSAAILAMASTAASAASIDTQVPGSDTNSVPCTPKQRTDDYHVNHFNEDISKSQGQEFDIVLFGDSITDFWNSNPNLSLDNNPTDTKTFNMGIGSDRVQNILWRLRNGALDGYTTKYLTLMIGINNGHQKCIDHNEHADRPEDVAESIRLMLKEMATRQPDAKILLMPILPYSFDSRYFEAAEVTAMSEAVNDYILQFVDNKRIFWIDLRGKYLNQDSTPNKVCYREGGHGGYDAVGLCLHPEFFTYSDFWKPAITNAMHKYLSGDVGVSHVAEPSIGYAKAAPNADGAGSATITVHGIFLGTDANANPVATYSIDYELDGGAKTRALSNQSLTRNSFVIPNVSLGQHTCRVTVTTADDKELVTVLDFTMTEPWFASPLSTDDSSVRTNGTLEYAYAPDACTVNGVSFTKANGSIDDANISWPYGSTSGASAPSSTTGAYHDLLNHCWWANQGDKPVTLKNLTPGRSYLVQIFGYRNYNNDSKAHVWIKESYWDPNFIKVYGDGWACGGTLTGTFTATAATKTFTITSDGNYGINGIQVRDLGESGAAVVVQPSIGSVSATTNGTAATVFLSGIVMGTDDAGTNATSYSVSYSLNNAAAVTALQNQTADTASFSIANLADGEYTCVVTITTDKNKTSAEKAVSFRIGPPPPEVVAPFIGSASVTTNGTTATIALSEITMGTDNAGVAASSYSVSYSLNSASAVMALSNQSGATASFDISGLADGSYKCVVTITTDKNKAAETTVSFRIGEPPPITVGWTVGPMSANGSTIRTDGDLLYAYAAQNGTVGGVSFVRDAPLGSGGMVSASPVPAMGGGSWGTEGVSGDFGTMLQNGWNWTGEGTELSYTLTLAGLTPGKNYLVQLVMHRQSQNMLVSVNGSAQAHVNGSDEEHYKYGASIVGLFTASAATQDLTVTYTERGGDRPLNAIQVRYLGDGGASVATVVAPSIGSAAAEVNGSTATISLSGVVMGTDDEGADATSYAVSYSLNGAAAVEALTGQSGATASFDIGNLADGEYACAVSITTDKNKTSAEKSVSFTIGTTPPPVVAPSIGAATAAVSGSNATVSLSGIVLGTDDEGAAATSYAVSYALNGGTTVAALANQTSATASFQIADLADGAYSCAVTITTDKGKTASKTVSFTIDTAGGGGTETGWTAQAMDDGGLAFSKEGDLAYAYSLQGLAVNGIPFSKANPIVASDSIAFDPGYTGFDGSLGNEGVSDTALGLMLGNAWYWKDTSTDTQTVTLTLKDLTVGHRYLVQILSHNTWTSGMRISAGGCEPQPVHGSDAAGGKYGALLTGVFTALATTEDVAITFSGSTSSMRPVNAVQVRDLGEVFVPVVEPSIGTLSAALSGPTAIIVLGDVEKGTDDKGVAATSYAVSYALDGGEPVEKLWNQTGWSAWFNVTNLADGAHTVEVTIATDAGGVASKTVSFTVDSTAPATSAWIVEPMSMSGDTIRTEGDLLYAEAPNLAVVNGVRFERTLWVSDASFTVSPAPADVLWSGMGNEGFNNEANAYGFLLTHAWFWDKSATNTAATVTLTGLTPGKNYLVQLVSHNQYTDTMTVSAEGTEPKPVGTRSHVENQSPTLPWRYGASLVGFFTASDTTQEFTIQWAGAAGYHPLNALQVRDLGLAVPVVVEPSIGAASATVDDDSKTAFVTLSGVVKGTDDACNPAASYDVWYELDGGASVRALEGRTGATAAFSIKNLADGPHECVVTITTDAGKSASATVSFTINEKTPPWIVEPMTEDGDTIRTNGVRRWAFCVGEDSGTLVANGVQFTTFENLDATRLQNAGDIHMPFSVSPAINSAVDGWGKEGVSDAGYAQILDRAFYNGASGEYTFTINGTLSGLKAGRRYLIQIIMHRSGSSATATVAADFDVDHVQFGGEGWTYGGSLVGTFVAPRDEADHTFTVKFEGGDFAAINAIQLRDLGPAVPTEVDPSVESVSAKRKGTTATVTLSGVEMGTDVDFHPATSYAVSYRLDGGAWTTVLPSENGETASFELTGLEYRTYVCEVKIETDVGKSTEPQAVTLAFAKADGLAIVLFDVEKETLAFDMGSESSVRALLPNADDIYCTLVTSTNLADVVWAPALPSLVWKANELPLDDESGWTWVGVDTADAVRFFRVALTAAPLAADDEVVFK